MSTDLGASFNEQYVNINTKLKKRFMRRPNISEATNEFIGLAIQCENCEQPTFAGQTYIGAAKCEASAGNILGEAENYIAAARQFMKAEKKLVSLKFDSPDRENLEAAIGCFLQALHKYPEKSPLRASILLEIANDLLEINHKLEAITYFKQALDIIQDETMKLMCMIKLFKMQIDSGKLDLALQTGNSITDLKCHVPERILAEIQVSRVLLALHVEMNDKNRTDSLKNLFTDLLNDDEENDTLQFNPDLKLKLQSIIISSNLEDQQALIAISMDTKPYLTDQQWDLLQSLISKKQED
ncbi:40-kDa huntingtin-associated protein [Pieris napi]|uniref:40-kDa huntingtin-associated protein n=1 Tax=Pieris napi TaxID=78633 RepID=UPI001FBBBD96|nr:40-kDa huntingtin-associated protein [Pieris napi]